MTLRLRLTLIYAVCFLIGGAALLGVTYGLFAHSISPLHYRFVPVTLDQARIDQLGRHPGQTREKFITTYPLNKHANKAIQQVQASVNEGFRTQHATALRSLLEKSGIALGLMALVSVLLGYLVAGRALRPLREMNERARQISEKNLHQRVGVGMRPDELGDLATTFDSVLARLERAFAAQQRFVANASHELRTPITVERTLVEVALEDPDASVESLRECCERVLASTGQQQRVIDALLTLARGQAGLRDREAVDLGELTAEMLEAWPDSSGVNVEATLEPAVVEGDRGLLERLVSNLIANATTHNLPADGWISVQTGIEAGRPLLTVSNSGPVVPPERVDELFEPFRRLEGERTGTGRGLGLGLSIVRAVAVAHDAELDCEARAEGGLRVRLRFEPASAGAGGPAPAGAARDRVAAGRVAIYP